MIEPTRRGWQRFQELQKRRFQDFLTRRIPPAARVTLNQRRLFIFPTRTGFFFGLCLLVMLITAINYQNNMSYALTFLLANLFVISVLHTYANLAGLTVRGVNAEPVFPGQQAEFLIQLDPAKGRRHVSVSIGWPDTGMEIFSLDRQQQQRISLYYPAAERGWYRPPRILIESVYPLGLLRCWTWIDLDIQVLVYPRPVMAPSLEGAESDTPDGSAEVIEGDDDFYGFRGYRPGDSLRRIHWKGLARNQELQVRLHSAYASRSLWLDWHMFPGAGKELKLSYLCYWVIQLEDGNEEYGLRLPGVTVTPGVGPLQRDRVLRELALY